MYNAVNHYLCLNAIVPVYTLMNCSTCFEAIVVTDLSVIYYRLFGCYCVIGYSGEQLPTLFYNYIQQEVKCYEKC